MASSSTLASAFCCCILLALAASSSVAPPLPVLPIPSARQLKWQKRERALFMHFGMNTFMDVEWGTGQTPPSTFRPGVEYSPRQWVSVAKEAGFSLVVLTAKHHDGFCLWPSKYTNYSVKSSTWKNGTGDVVRDLVEAANEAGIEVGLYLSPWDRHDSSYGDTLKYNKHYLAQTRELLTNYGTISEFWLDGAKGDNTTMDYDFNEWFELVHQLQPEANIFSDAGPDVRWVGDEQGQAGKTCWSMVDRSNIQIGNSSDILPYLNEGDKHGHDWVPPECDVSIRTGWFWHKEQKPKDVETLLEIYYNSTGRNCVLLLNTPPTTSGLLDSQDVKVLQSFNQLLTSVFSVNLACSAVSFSASSTLGDGYTPDQVISDELSTYWSAKEGETSGWIELQLAELTAFNVIKIQEPISLGQRVEMHRIEAWNPENGWFTVAHGTTIGYKRLHRLGAFCRAEAVKLVIPRSRTAPPLVAAFGLYLDLHAT